MNNRNHLAAMHGLAEEPIHEVSGTLLDQADALAAAGNWFVAADIYSRIESKLSDKLDPMSRAKLLTRSATYFAIAGQNLPAAKNYSAAAFCLSNATGHEQTSGELFNRSAHCYQHADDHFNAGVMWNRAAENFAKLGSATITSRDSIKPVPWSGFAVTIAGSCYEAAAAAFLRADGTNRNGAVPAFWNAGNANSQLPFPNIQTFWSYKSALESGIKLYGSVLPERTTNYLPYSDAERAKKLDAVETMEKSLYDLELSSISQSGHKKPAETAQLLVDEQMISVFQDFSLLLASRGNADEASHFRVLQNRRIESANWKKRRIGRWLMHSIWRLTSSYGESLGRWFICTTAAIFVFALGYHLTNGARPTDGFLDCLYFSIVTFTSLGYGDIQPVGAAGRFLASVEIVLGLMFFGVLLTFLNNRVSRR